VGARRACRRRRLGSDRRGVLTAVTLHELLIAIAPLLPLIGFFWANCPCCTPGCENCPEATDALAVTLAGIVQRGTYCTQCADFNATWILPYWPESTANSAAVCQFRFPMEGAGGCGDPVDLMASLLSHATLPTILVNLSYHPVVYPPAHAGAGGTLVRFNEDNGDGLTQAELCDTYDLGFDFETTALDGGGSFCDASAATCHVEGA
jgi:hypothetical protein